MPIVSASTFRAWASGSQGGMLGAGLRILASWAEVPVAWYVRRRNAAYDNGRSKITRVAAPVVSLGNLTVGGTGKTPFVAWLAQWFQAQHVAVTLISRGYGSRTGRTTKPANLPFVCQVFPIFKILTAWPQRRSRLRPSRGKSCSWTMLFNTAHCADLDIVLLDALDPFGCGHLLPRGLLREPPASLQRADVVALSRDAISKDERAALHAEVRKISRRTRIGWKLFIAPRICDPPVAGSRRSKNSILGSVAAFCGLGNPAGFQLTLAQQQIALAGWKAFPDHCPYNPRQVRLLETWLRQLAADRVVCTMKDLVKLPAEEIAGLPLWGLAVEMEITVGRELLERRLKEIAARVT